jgi:hypothetical protein
MDGWKAELMDGWHARGLMDAGNLEDYRSMAGTTGQLAERLRA